MWAVHLPLVLTKGRMKLTNRSLLIIIMIVAAVLRFYNYFEIPFTHDEFSALFRTNFPDFQTLIDQGVKVDGHPAGVQVFLYYWVQLFGIHEWSIKLPFTLMGIASVYLMYLIAKFWYNETVALISISFFATLNEPLLLLEQKLSTEEDILGSQISKFNENEENKAEVSISIHNKIKKMNLISNQIQGLY